MRKAVLLRRLERGMLALGLSLGAWCAVVIVRAEIVARMPIPDRATATAPARGAWVARLDAPSLRWSATVLEGSDEATLERAAGHIEHTALPGEPGNIGIAGHRDTTFLPVRHLRPGDPIELTTSDRVYRYLITKTFIVDPQDVYVLDPTDRPTLTLVTCYPFRFFGHAPRRYIIQAELVHQAARAVVAVN